jgi:fructose-bisphosphate aldolase, class II
MPLVNVKSILDKAEKGVYGVPALNINEMLQLQAYLNAAFESKSPIILQASMKSREFIGWTPKKVDSNMGAGITIEMIKTFVAFYEKEYRYKIPVAINLDHGPNFESCKSAIDMGFTSIMIDGSLDYSKKDNQGNHPAKSFEDNIKLTKKVTEYAHKKGVSAEGELGNLGGIEDDTKSSSTLLTDPEQVLEFVTKTGVDCLAVAIGTSHGAYKFKAEPRLALDLLPKIKKNAKGARLVMHGSSSVPQEFISSINKYPVIHIAENKISINGLFNEVSEKKSYDLDSEKDMENLRKDLKNFSCMKRSCGVPISEIKKAIKLGIRKINVDTDGRLATTAGIKRFMAENPDVFDQRKYFAQARNALYEMAKSKIIDFGCYGKAK